MLPPDRNPLTQVLRELDVLQQVEIGDHREVRRGTKRAREALERTERGEHDRIGRARAGGGAGASEAQHMLGSEGGDAVEVVDFVRLSRAADEAHLGPARLPVGAADGGGKMGQPQGRKQGRNVVVRLRVGGPRWLLLDRPLVLHLALIALAQHQQQSALLRAPLQHLRELTQQKQRLF